MDKFAKIGETLLEQEMISKEDLDLALEEEKATGKKISSILLQRGLATEEQMYVALSTKLQIPYIHLQYHKMRQNYVKLLSEQVARRYQAVVIDEINGTLLVGLSEPANITTRDQLSRILKKRIRFALVKESDVIRWLNQAYRKIEEINNIALELNQELTNKEGSDTQVSSEDEETPVMKILEAIFKDALQHGASDIHIEPGKKVIRIRQRIDGVLVEHTMNEVSIAPALILRLKLLAELNISEKRLPQDGRFNIKIMDKSVDVRLSTMPIEYGESAVMRLIESSSGIRQIDDIGLPEDILKRLKYCINRPHGVILVTGPTGSGKTTTLYSCLSSLNDEGRKIITVEDPIEFSLDRICQVQVNSKIDLTFARVLRSALRQDPDIIMVGEMRDKETASIGLRAAITGHLVLSTLHTNDSISTINRLIDMGIEPFLVASAIRAIIAQRLIRRLCLSCKIDHIPDEEEITFLNKISGHDISTMQFKASKGCASCNHIGFRGRIGVYEMLELSNEAMSALREGDTESYIINAKKSKGYKPLVFDALKHAASGETSLAEVIKIAGEMED